MSKPTSGLYIPVVDKEGQFLFSIPVKTREDITEVATKMVTNPANGEKFSFGTKNNKIFLTYNPSEKTDDYVENDIDVNTEENTRASTEADTNAGTNSGYTRRNFNNPTYVKRQYGCKHGNNCTWKWNCRFQCSNFQDGKCDFDNCAFHHFPNYIATEAAEAISKEEAESAE